MIQALKSQAGKVKQDKATTAGEKPANFRKNRYKDILPCKYNLHIFIKNKNKTRTFMRKKKLTICFPVKTFLKCTNVSGKIM